MIWQDAHVKGLAYLLDGGETSFFNLGNGSGFTVKEVIETARAGDWEGDCGDSVRIAALGIHPFWWGRAIAPAKSSVGIPATPTSKLSLPTPGSGTKKDTGNENEKGPGFALANPGLMF